MPGQDLGNATAYSIRLFLQQLCGDLMRDHERRNRGNELGRVNRESLLSVASFSASASDTVLGQPGWEQRRVGQVVSKCPEREGLLEATAS